MHPSPFRIRTPALHHIEVVAVFHHTILVRVQRTRRRSLVHLTEDTRLWSSSCPTVCILYLLPDWGPNLHLDVVGDRLLDYVVEKYFLPPSV